MRNQGQLVAGAIIILVGLMILAGNLFNVNLWAICWPVGLILLGLWVLLRPQLVKGGSGVSLVPIGNIRRDETWQVADEEFWVFVGDIDLDLAEADIPLGETRFQTFGFVGDIELLVPADVGVAISATAFVSTVKAFGDKVENFLIPSHVTSANYDAAERKIRLDTVCFVGDIKVKRYGS